MSGIIHILIGISNSGKSTVAHEKWLQDPLNTIIVNRDKIRELIGAFTEQTIQDWYHLEDINQLEKMVSDYEDLIIERALEEDKAVIIDATHLKHKYLKRFQQYNCDKTITFFDITLEEALERNSKRNRKVSEEIIIKQKQQYDSIRKTSMEEITSLVDFGQSFLP